ncbi:MAG: helix-turn-helix domain-containing protein [Candidatus Marinimicrobia bacterium]|nr:helix-turn-helix domain-containing protein [Candidatus Neomarinimicrobiota bacterium]
MKNPHLKSFDEHLNERYGKKGTKTRDEFDRESESFRLGVLVSEARKEKGLTQEELAQKIGSTKSYISKIENGVKEARVSTLQRIIEDGLGGKLHLSVEFK